MMATTGTAMAAARRGGRDLLRIAGATRCLSVDAAQIGEIGEKLRQNGVETVVMAYPDIYGRLLGKRYDTTDFVVNAAKAGAHSCSYTFAVDMPMNPLEGFEFANWGTGFGDFHMVPDLDSLTICGWNPGTAIVLCDALDTKTHELVPFAPRSILKRQLARMQEARVGVDAVKAASELEHYLFDDSFRECHEKDYAKMRPAGYYSEDYHILQGHRTEPYHAAVRRGLRASGIPVENSKGETGIGQHEINVQYDECLRMADRHMLFKQCMKEIAMDQGKAVTFMAKPFDSDAGSSCHIHMSLYGGAEDTNLFQGSETLDEIQGCSPLFRQWLAGWMAHTPELFAFYAPTVNSYKRFQAGSWAPTATCWGSDNRTAGFRVVGGGPSLRIECRLPGADANPYLAFAAAVASGLDGVTRDLSPPPMLRGDGYQASKADPTEAPPMSLVAAADRLESSDFANEVFGEPVVKHYAHFYRLEQRAFDQAVTDWERRRYFEQI